MNYWHLFAAYWFGCLVVECRVMIILTKDPEWSYFFYSSHPIRSFLFIFINFVIAPILIPLYIIEMLMSPNEDDFWETKDDNT